MKRIALMFITSMLTFCAFAQRQMETLDRGLVAVKVNAGVYTSWRIPGDEWYDVKYNLYRDGVKVNAEPLNASNYTDCAGTLSSTYTVKAVVNGVEKEACAPAPVWEQQYKSIKMNDLKSSRGFDMNGAYSLNDVSVADLNSDGRYDFIVKRMNTDFTLANDSAYTLFQAYTFDGDLLWEINMGPNLINAGHVETNCMAFDFDEDGRTEVVLRATDGTILPDGTVIGNKTINYRTKGTFEYQIYGDEFLVVLDGKTGKLIDQTEFLRRGNSGEFGSGYWGDGYGHRANKFYFGAPYLDGRHPSIYIGRGCYTNYHAVAYNLVNNKLVQLWTYAIDDASSPYYGQGYHNFSIVDVDMDGRDEICAGNMVLDDNGQPLSSTGLGHGDAQHYGNLDPYRKGVEGFRCLESNPGAILVDAATSEILLRWKRDTDCGRALAGNFSNDYPGAECNTVGHLWSASTSRRDDQVLPVSASGITMNYRIYWDGDLLEESFDYGNRNTAGDGFDGTVFKMGVGAIWSAPGTMTCNNTKGTPCMQADILGDWREEIVLRTPSNDELRIYTTTDYTKYRIYSLLYDHQYRQAVYWQMCAYNQPPHCSFFLGELEDMTEPTPPSCSNGRVEVDNSITSATDGQFLQLANTKATTVNVSGTVAPSNVIINSPADYVVKGGTFAGNMRMLKLGLGDVLLDGGTYSYTGNTEVWGGSMTTNASINESPIFLKRFGELNAADGTTFNKGIKMEHGAVLRPGGKNAQGTIMTSTLDLDGGSVIVFDLYNADNAADLIKAEKCVIGKINPVGKAPIFRFASHTLGDVLAAGDYKIMETSAVEGDLSTVEVEGLDGISYTLNYENGGIILRVSAMRASASIVWTGAQGSTWNLADVKNFSNGGSEDFFVTGDVVTFDETATNKTVDIAETVNPAGVIVNGASNYTFKGAGKISGKAYLEKNGSGILTVQNTNDFTGGVRINEGTVSVTSLSDAQNVGALGAYTTSVGKFYIGDGATLKTTADVTNDAPIKFGVDGVINNGGSFLQNTAITGTSMVKTGTGQLRMMQAAQVKKVTIKEGSIRVEADYDKVLGDTLQMSGGSILYNNNSGTYSTTNTVWYVPKGAKGSVTLDCRCNYRNMLVGEGTLTVNLPDLSSCPRCYFYGDWSKFEGTVNFVMPNESSAVALTNTKGMPNAVVNIATAGHSIQIGGSNVSTTGTYTIGSLTGKGTLNAGTSTANAFSVGSLNKNFQFDGVSNAVLNKVGTGTMTMTANTGSGAVYVQQGTLRVKNTPTVETTCSGNAMLTICKDAVLTGSAYMGNSKVQVLNGGTIQPGYYYAGAMVIKGHLQLDKGSKMVLRINSSSSMTKNTAVEVRGACLFDGTIEVNMVTSGYEPAIGDSFTLWTCKTWNKAHTPEAVILPELPQGMRWDTTNLYTTEGKIEIVADETAIGEVAANETVHVVMYALNGQQAATYDCAYSEINEIASRHEVPTGIYMLKITGLNVQTVRKYVKR